MEFQHRYFGQSQATHTPEGSALSFAPDTLRPPVYFSGQLAQHLPFREAISAMHDVVVSDLRTLPRERPEYFAWLKDAEAQMLAEFMQGAAQAKTRMAAIDTELAALRSRKSALLGPFYSARKKYFDHLYKTDFSRWVVLDPVITVHPDRIFFECFSKDESTYSVLSCSHNVFSAQGEFACGTTNIDYSAGLYDEFQKIRGYRKTHLAIEPTGFTVQNENDPSFVEQKIDVPDSWVRGFLQVSSAMTQPAQRVHLHPMDLYNICQTLRRRKERGGPRSLRFELQPGAPVRIVFEPWNLVLECPRSTHEASEAQTIRIWGRRRLLVLERMIPVADRLTVHLLGTGLPSFWVVDMGELQFTLGLSGWTANDWSRNGQFDLMGSREHTDTDSRNRVYDQLCQHWQMESGALARACNLEPAFATACLQLFTQSGRVMYDLANGVYRLRELTREPLPMNKLRFANEREEEAAKLVADGCVEGFRREGDDQKRSLSGKVRDAGKQHDAKLTVDANERIASAECSCDFHFRNRLRRGPCAHLLALRLIDGQRRLQDRAARAADRRQNDTTAP
ncbi:hypothetical protein [Uliginosibacterium gangwonense]|uniref:hypothetical protein n=1 Tax=Uliginosibacterium gangwonense TaxID=392736 RepID=UPI00037A6936|nr:hypothetical protein [Uliginosibacterium gangwonense]